MYVEQWDTNSVNQQLERFAVLLLACSAPKFNYQCIQLC